MLAFESTCLAPLSGIHAPFTDCTDFLAMVWCVGSQVEGHRCTSRLTSEKEGSVICVSVVFSAATTALTGQLLMGLEAATVSRMKTSRFGAILPRPPLRRFAAASTHQSRFAQEEDRNKSFLLLRVPSAARASPLFVEKGHRPSPSPTTGRSTVSSSSTPAGTRIASQPLSAGTCHYDTRINPGRGPFRNSTSRLPTLSSSSRLKLRPSPLLVGWQPDEDGEEQQDELEVTGEGTAGGPFGLKKVLFVRKKSEKAVGPKEVRVRPFLPF